MQASPTLQIINCIYQDKPITSQSCFFIKQTNVLHTESNPTGYCSRGRGPKTGDLGADTGGRKWLHGQAQPQFRLCHPQLRLEQQQLSLATITGTGEKRSCVRLNGYPQARGLWVSGRSAGSMLDGRAETRNIRDG